VTAAHALPPTGPYAGDDGSPDGTLAAVLAAHEVGAADLRAVQHALLAARLLVPVIATEDDLGTSMATVTITGRDGRRAMPVFTSVTALAAWDVSARPVPTAAVVAAAGALADGAAALLIDLCGPVHVVLEGPAMLALAQGRRWLAPAEDPEVLTAVQYALAGMDGLCGLDVGRCADADLALTLHVVDAGPAQVRALAQDAAARLAEVELLRDRLERGLDLAVVPGRSW
jgi:hypothetical protein